ncbi:bifunctional [glutamate--ammonia ligase]-adenylyl-L-tyrosine phosphorylase/[glutamate--ammonia-ligase] adenylyltransferase [Aliikangiella marina]|uniref:Bifunctional glutamine synthetase adenylyltransferase/adenylyl-removing enzyme n=1 Tax=Aliikangiella marina TaxID=1712262 RepID=A0A545TCH9_9GAMM|nr:bifunctional [glutamate--ammonia ligase]-adenylyl-L-tyrosine phosphorylase/[glutamate--ammonia-ligase] adenylyltransferase [Aliikangiella marina]TQV74901.1 bifunctional [glutamate--ammonia ligase]-adenylyl-L-tyrosine phosphorylase/[glutamate--ammonia-ligase] adenylyltransferase [Aliikangiella marina]
MANDDSVAPLTKLPKDIPQEWQESLLSMQTMLSPDVFHFIVSAYGWSEFVRRVAIHHQSLFCEALHWHFTHQDEVIVLEMPALYRDHVADTLDSESQYMTRIREFRMAHSAAIAVLELNNVLPIESSSFRISILADTLISGAYHWGYQHHTQQFGVPCDAHGRRLHLLIIAMGKLGGHELNFSSDVDLIFLYPEEGTTQGDARTTDNSRFFRRVSTQLIRVLDEVTADGFVFRVDMRLRPYGESGALVMSLAQAEEYYQEQGREWERFAMLRSRVLTGEAIDKKALDDIIRPFSFRRYIDYGVIDSIRSMKEMIQREVRRKGLTDNIKLGAGGIREVEFIAQSLQLIQGGRDKRLREKNVFKVLPILVEAKLLPETVQVELLAAYRFLRRLEHCIQELAEKQTQTLPTDNKEQQILAEVMRCSSWSDLLNELSRVQQLVNHHFNGILGEERQQGAETEDFYAALAHGDLTAQSLRSQLLASDPEDSNREGKGDQYSLENLTDFIKKIEAFNQESAVVNLSTRGAKRLKTFFPALLAACLKTQQPNITLIRLLRVIRAVLKRTAYLELLSENPPILQHLVDLAGQSEWMVARLSAYPVLFDELLYPNSLYAPLQITDLQSELQQALLRIDLKDEEELLDALRAFKQINELRVAAALLAERLSISQVSRYLTQLAEVILQACVDQCWRMMKERYGEPEKLNNAVDSLENNYGFAVIGYGKLGGIELGFGSDLDLVFLFNRPIDGSTDGARSLNNSRFYTRLAQKLIHFLSTRTNLGLLYEVDMRLRPSGSSGLLVSHIDSYREYQMESAWTWEHQALIRARYVAGDPNVANEFAQARSNTLHQLRDREQLQKDVSDMRHKMRDQLEAKQSGKVDLKQSPGGLVDIEFLAQFACLAYQGEAIIPHSTSECLKFAGREALLKSEEARELVKIYRLFRNRLNEMALTSGGNFIGEEQFERERRTVQKIWKTYLNTAD